MNDNVLVSAIITTYKRESKILQRAIESVLNQTYKNIELIIVNDYPAVCENNTEIEKLIDEYKLSYNIRYIVVSQNGGACKARNLGIKESNGIYIGFLDDDDEWCPEKIETMVQILNNNPNVAIAYSNAIIFDEDKKNNRYLYNEEKPSGNIYNNLFITNIIGSNSFPLHRKSIITKYGGFDENLPAMQDLELYLRICKDNDVVYIGKPLSIYHVYSGERITRNTKKRVLAFEMIQAEFKEDIISDKSRYYYVCRRAIDVYSLNSNYLKALNYFAKEVSLKPLKVAINIKDLLKIFVRIFYKKTSK